MNNKYLKPCLRMMASLSFTFLLVSPQAQPAAPSPVVHPTPEWAKDKVIYEVNLRQYSPSGSLKAFEAHLPRLKEMGVGVLWFMPIHPVGEKNRKGSLGSYYAVKDYQAVDPAYGTFDEFKGLVKKIHEMGMYVIIDWVANHSAWDNEWAIRHPEWYEKDEQGNLKSPFDWSDVVEFDYNQPGIRKKMTEALKFWVKEANIDGFRCDVADMVPLDFWINARAELDAIRPVFMLAESEKVEMHQAFDMTYNWEIFHLMNKIAKGEKQANAMWDQVSIDDKNFPVGAYRMLFITNHDENSWNGTEFERMGQGVEAFYILAATLPGMPLIYSGQEAALNKRLKFFEKDPIDWNDYPMQGFYSALNQLKKNNQALWNGKEGGMMTRLDPGNPNILAYSRERDGRKVLVLLNLSNAEQDFSLETKRLPGTYTELFFQTHVSFQISEKFHLKPWEYRVFSR